MNIRNLTFPAAFLTLTVFAGAQIGSTATTTRALALDTGTHFATGERAVPVWETTVQVEGTAWLRLVFGDTDVGRHSFVEVESVLDGAVHRMTSRELEKWSDHTAYFNGDMLVVRLWVDPRDGVASAVLDRAIGGVADAPQETICGTADDRVRVTDDRVGRLAMVPNAYCTAWRCVNGAVVTAGHCVDFDPDGFGPGLPDGSHDLTGAVVQFNVPSSTSSGIEQHPPVEDQFPFDSTIAPRWEFDGEGMGLGKDWAVFAVTENNIGQVMHERYGFPLRVSRELPASNDDVTIRGHGIDDRPAGSGGGRNSDSETLQTDTGGFNGENSSGTSIWLRYRVDTEGANSGSPVLYTTGGQRIAIGVHTNGGCGVLIGTNNTGTSMEKNALEAALNLWLDTAVEFVDDGHPLPVSESGQIYRPWDTVPEGVSAIPAGGTVAIVAGTYSEAEGNVFTTTKAMTLVAPCGTVTIGN